MCWSSLSGGGPGPFCMSGDNASGARATALASWSSIASRGNTNEFVGTGATQNADVVLLLLQSKRVSLRMRACVFAQMALNLLFKTTLMPAFICAHLKCFILFPGVKTLK